jgi:hypothetical protein
MAFFQGIRNSQAVAETMFRIRFEPFFLGLQQKNEDLKKRYATTGERFNVFDALNVRDSELANSSFLAYWLSPHALHDQGDRFLRAFLGLIGMNDIPPPQVLSKSRVHVEFFAGSKGRLDVVVFLGDGRIVAIENKIWAGEQEGQIDRYQQWLCAQRASQAGVHRLVFLTLTGAKPTTGGDAEPEPVLLDHRAIASCFAGEAENLPVCIKVVLQMYLEVINAIGGMS